MGLPGLGAAAAGSGATALFSKVFETSKPLFFAAEVVAGVFIS